ncbi:MAG: hypothetical protein Q9218_001469 [Villophora microphyllina]
MSRPASSPPYVVPPPSKRPKLGHTTSATEIPSSSSSATTPMATPPQQSSPPLPPYSADELSSRDGNLTDLLDREATRMQAANHLVRARNELLEHMRASGVKKSVLTDGAGNVVGGDSVSGAGGSGEQPRPTWPRMGIETMQGEDRRLQAQAQAIGFFTERYAQHDKAEKEKEKGAAAPVPGGEDEVVVMSDSMSTEGSVDSDEEYDLFGEELLEGMEVPDAAGGDGGSAEKDGRGQLQAEAEGRAQEEGTSQEKTGETAVRQESSNEDAEVQQEYEQAEEIETAAQGDEEAQKLKKKKDKGKGKEKARDELPKWGKQDWELATSNFSGGRLGSMGGIEDFKEGMSGIVNSKKKECEDGEDEESVGGSYRASGEQRDEGKGKEKEIEEGNGSE